MPEKSSGAPEQGADRGVWIDARVRLDWLDGGLIGKMRRKDEMETLVTKKPPPSHEGSAQKPRKTSGNHKALITRNLRLAFGEVASEPVPDRFLDLLGQIDTAEGKKQ